MLTIKTEEKEIWDPRKREFIYLKPQTLQLEHSLISLQKWESKYKKPFLHTKFNDREFLDYIECMTLNKNVSPQVYLSLTNNDYNQIADYMNDSMTATIINDNRRKGKINDELITAEIIYYWMVCYTIPFNPCEKWHIQRLLTLIQVCSIKSEKPKKMSKSDIYARNKAINAKNRAKYHTKG